MGKNKKDLNEEIEESNIDSEKVILIQKKMILM